ncbi:hypothetical protein MMC28_009838 [Mycoblastus sanguinarius]|nr:hypothetical protein [Mycoblastus sanguinarius]
MAKKGSCVDSFAERHGLTNSRKEAKEQQADNARRSEWMEGVSVQDVYDSMFQGGSDKENDYADFAAEFGTAYDNIILSLWWHPPPLHLQPATITQSSPATAPTVPPIYGHRSPPPHPGFPVLKTRQVLQQRLAQTTYHWDDVAYSGLPVLLREFLNAMTDHGVPHVVASPGLLLLRIHERIIG